MSRAPLTHAYPQWAPPLDDPSAPPEDYVEVFIGRMRIVKNRRRARLLKRRGVPMWRTSDCWLWFTELPDSYTRVILDEPYAPGELCTPTLR